MVRLHKARSNCHEPPVVAERKTPIAKVRRVKASRAEAVRVEGSPVGDDLVEAFEEMAKHLRGEIELQAHHASSDPITPSQIKAIRRKVAPSTKEFERLFGIPARTMEAYEQGRRNPDGAMRALLRFIDREPEAALKALAA